MCACVCMCVCVCVCGWMGMCVGVVCVCHNDKKVYRRDGWVKRVVRVELLIFAVICREFKT